MISVAAGLLAFWTLAVPANAASPADASAGASTQESDFTLPPATSAPHINFSADHFDYEESSSLVHLKGNVEMKESTWSIRSDEVWLDMNDRHAWADGAVQMDDGVSRVVGDSGDFYFGASTGSVGQAYAGMAPWRIHGETAYMDAQRDLYFQHAWFSSCNLDVNPHYHFASSSIYVKPHKYLMAWNTVFYLGNCPLFYTPFMYRTLGKPLLRTKVSPGYDHRNGAFLKSTTFYDPNPYTSGRFYMDYYGAQGLGLGDELTYKHLGVGSGGLYGYYIHEKDSGLSRWGASGSDFQNVASSTTFQMRLQSQSDSNFNNDYNRSLALPISPELNNSAALTHQTKLTTLRLSYSRIDDVLPDNHYAKTTEDSPRVDFLTAPLNLGLPFLNTFNAFADNAYNSGYGFLQKSVGAGWQGTRSFSIVRGVTVTPTAGFSETYLNRFDDFTALDSSQTYLDDFVARYSMGGDLRFNTVAGYWDLTENYTRRLRPDSFARDDIADDRGVESNLTSLTDLFRPSRRVMVRVGSGYDWRTYDDHVVEFRDRLQPITADIDYLPLSLPLWDFSAHDGYQLDGGNQSVALEAEYGERKKNFMGFGFGNTVGASNQYFFSQEFSLAPTSGPYSMGGVLRQAVGTDGGGMRIDRFSLFDKEMWLTKDWHDFVTRLQFRIRPGGVKEVEVQVQIRLDKERPLPSDDTPERQHNDNSSH